MSTKVNQKEDIINWKELLQKLADTKVKQLFTLTKIHSYGGKHENSSILTVCLAKRYFCIPATSVRSKEVFSVAGNILNEQLNKYMRLYANFELLS